MSESIAGAPSVVSAAVGLWADEVFAIIFVSTSSKFGQRLGAELTSRAGQRKTRKLPLPLRTAVPMLK